MQVSLQQRKTPEGVPKADAVSLNIVFPMFIPVTNVNHQEKSWMKIIKIYIWRLFKGENIIIQFLALWEWKGLIQHIWFLSTIPKYTKIKHFWDVPYIEKIINYETGASVLDVQDSVWLAIFSDAFFHSPKTLLLLQKFAVINYCYRNIYFACFTVFLMP